MKDFNDMTDEERDAFDAQPGVPMTAEDYPPPPEDETDLPKGWKVRGEAPRAGQAPKSKPLQRISELARHGLDRADARKLKQEIPVPVPWERYGEIMGGGLWPGLHVLVAGTGAGKTTFSTQIAIEAASRGFPVAYIGLELDEAQVGLRMVAEKAHVSWSDLYLGRARADHRERAEAAIGTMAEWPLFAEFGETSGWKISRLTDIAQQLKAESIRLAGDGIPKPSLIVLDFLQLIDTDTKMELRERIGRASNAARQIARDHNAAVLVVSSSSRMNYGILSGSSEKGTPSAGIKAVTKGQVQFGVIMNPDALVGTGKEAGEIEYSADSVTVITKDKDRDGNAVFCVCVPKLRYGPTGWCAMSMQTCRFSEIGFNYKDWDEKDRPDLAKRLHAEIAVLKGNGAVEPTVESEDEEIPGL